MARTQAVDLRELNVAFRRGDVNNEDENEVLEGALDPHRVDERRAAV